MMVEILFAGSSYLDSQRYYQVNSYWHLAVIKNQSEEGVEEGWVTITILWLYVELSNYSSWTVAIVLLDLFHLFMRSEKETHA